MQTMTSKHRARSVTLTDLYGNYLKKHPKGTKNYLELNEFKKASRLIFNKIVDEILLGKRYKLPHSLGVLYLDKFKLNGKRKVDFGSTRKYGKTIYHTNLHSDGLTYKLKWFKASSMLKNKAFYKFKLTRKHSRRLSTLIKQNKIKVFKYYG